MVANEHTQDWIGDDDGDIGELVALSARLEARPLDIASCWMSESGESPHAQNPHGYASGLNQLMPDTARGMGWLRGDPRWSRVDTLRHQRAYRTHPPDEDAQMVAEIDGLLKALMAPYIALPVSEQLKWVERFYAPHKGELVSPGACYLCTFAPGLMAHAGDPSFVIVDEHGVRASWYDVNRALDVNGDGRITVQDLTDRIARVTTGPRWEEFAARVRGVQERRATAPELPEVRDGEEDLSTSDTEPAPCEGGPGNDASGPAAA